MSRRTVPRLFPFVLLPFTTAALSLSAMAQQSAVFTPGNVVVTVEGCGVHGGTCASVPNGTGTGAGNSSAGGYGDNQAAPLTLFQYAPMGTAGVTYVNSLVLPQTASGANLPISGEYGSSSEATLHLSTGGQYLSIAAYGIDAPTFDASPTTYGAAPSNALAQSGSLTGQSSYTPVARVIALIDAYGNVNTSSALFNIYNLQNPRSGFTADGLTAYISGQSTGTDAYGGVFYTPLFTTNTAPTAITGLDSTSNTTSQDTRDVQIYNGTLYVSADTKQGSNAARSFVGTLGTPPATSLYMGGAGATQLVSSNNAASPTAVTSNGKLVLTASETNGINIAGQQINLSPSGYFFANPYTMYIADTGNPKQNSASTLLGDGGLQKWVNTKTDGSGTWQLLYTISAGLNLVSNPTVTPANTSGSTGLYGVTGVVNGSSVYLYATNFTINDLDATYLYGFTDQLAATSKPATAFTQLAAAPADSNFKGVALAPGLPAGSATITSTPSGVALTASGSGCAPGSYVTPVTLLWTPNSSCTLTVASKLTAQGTQYVFSGWQDGTKGTTDTVIAPATSGQYHATFAAATAPLGVLEAAVGAATDNTLITTVDNLYVTGWTADVVDGSPLHNVQVYVDGKAVGMPYMGDARAAVATQYANPAFLNSGYHFFYPASQLSDGPHAVTVVATDSLGLSTTFGPKTITIQSAYPAPVGHLDNVDFESVLGSAPQTQYNVVTVTGWAADPTDGTPLPILHLLVDGNQVEDLKQGIARPDVVVTTGNPRYANSGYTGSFSANALSVGTHSVTVVALNSHLVPTTFGPFPFTRTPNSSATTSLKGTGGRTVTSLLGGSQGVSAMGRMTSPEAVIEP